MESRESAVVRPFSRPNSGTVSKAWVPIPGSSLSLACGDAGWVGSLLGVSLSIALKPSKSDGLCDPLTSGSLVWGSRVGDCEGCGWKSRESSMVLTSGGSEAGNGDGVAAGVSLFSALKPSKSDGLCDLLTPGSLVWGSRVGDCRDCGW